jgi:Uma2 family endonuclease
VKIPLYGRSGIIETWLIDLDRRVIEVYRGPYAAGYLEKRTHRPGDQLLVQALPDFNLAVAEILGVAA